MSWTSTGQAAEVLVSGKDIEEMTGGIIKESTLRWWRHEGKGVGPRSFVLGKRKVVYKRTDVIAWLEAQYNAEQAS